MFRVLGIYNFALAINDDGFSDKTLMGHTVYEVSFYFFSAGKT